MLRTTLMLSAAVAGDAPASVMLIKVLKNDPTFGLPPAIPQTFGMTSAGANAATVDAAEREKIKARRKEEQKKKQASEALRRQQILQSRRSVN